MIKKILIKSKTINFDLRYNKLNKHIRIRVTEQDGLIVSAPFKTSFKQIEHALVHHQDWILAKLAATREKQVQTGFKSGDSLPYMGKCYPLKLIRVNQERVNVAFDSEGWEISVPKDFGEQEVQTCLAKALRAWYLGQAKLIIPSRTGQWAEKMQLHYQRISIRDQKSRWGSCSQLTNLNFNWRLILTPLEVLDYVVIHELCHLKELNHSQAFWRLVATYCPDFAEQKRWLKNHGSELFQY